MRREERRQRVVEVCLGVLGGAEGTRRHDLGPVLQVQQAGLDADELGAQGGVGRRQRLAGPDRSQPREEHVCRDLQAGGGEFEDILGREGREREEEEHEGDGGEDREGAERGRR